MQSKYHHVRIEPVEFFELPDQIPGQTVGHGRFVYANDGGGVRINPALGCYRQIRFTGFARAS